MTTMTKDEALMLLAKHGYTERDGIWYRPNGHDTMRLVAQVDGTFKFDCEVTSSGRKALRKERREAYANM